MAQIAFHGNIGKVREIKFGQDNKARLSFSVGESHSRFNNQTNQWEQTGTTWHNVTIFGKRAESLAGVLQEGAKQQVVVIGRSSTREYESNGNKGESFDCVAEVVGLIPKAQQQGNSPQNGYQAQQQAPANQAFGGQPAQGQQGQGWNQPANDPWQSSGGGGWGNPGANEPPY